MKVAACPWPHCSTQIQRIPAGNLHDGVKLHIQVVHDGRYPGRAALRHADHHNPT